MQGQSGNSNPKHWTAIYVLPIQLWEVESWPAFGFFSKLQLQLFGEAKGFNSAGPAHRNNFNMFCIVQICMIKCMVSVILPSPTARNDSDSVIASGPRLSA